MPRTGDNAGVSHPESPTPAPADRTPHPLTVARAVMAGAIVAAVVAQFLTTLRVVTERGDEHVGIDVLNFFSFFTIQSNVVAALTLAVLVVFALRGRPPGGALVAIRLCATTFMLITGIVYNALLRGIPLPQGDTVAWANEVMHLIGPLWMLADWLLARERTPPRWADLRYVIAYPLLWLAYTLIRGPFTPNQVTGGSSWYPYPFLDPDVQAGGYGGVALMCVAIAAAFVGVGCGLVAVARRRGTPARPTTAHLRE